MTAAALYFRRCDGCPATSAPTLKPNRSLIEAKRDGWTRELRDGRRGIDFCPRCTTRRAQMPEAAS